MKTQLIFLIALVFIKADDLTRMLDSGDCADTTNYFIYMGQCIAKTCLYQKLARIRLTPIDKIYSNNGTLTLGIFYTAQSVFVNNQTIYRVSIKYTDDEDNQIVSDPINCVDWAVYQTKNDATIDPSRMNVYKQNQGAKPIWPLPTYTFFQDVASISFDITQSDLDTRQCIKFYNKGLIEWQCFFEFAFMVQGVTQVSYYMGINILLNTNVANSAPLVNFVKLVQVDQCSNSQCSVQTSVGSNLMFCSDSTCQNTAQSPFFVLFVNRPFWLKYQITDSSFNSWYITQVGITYQTQGFKLKLASNEFKTLQQQPGFNIHELRVPIVASQVLINAQGIISQTKDPVRFLQTSNSTNSSNQPVSYAAASAGQVLDGSTGSSSNANHPYTILIGVIWLLLSILHN